MKNFSISNNILMKYDDHMLTYRIVGSGRSRDTDGEIIQILTGLQQDGQK